MRIAILTPTFNYHSGMDRVAQQQAEDYVKKGHKVTIIALEAKIKSSKYTIIELGMPRNRFFQIIYRLFFFLDSKKLNYYKKLKDVDVVISYLYPMTWLAYKAKKKFNLKYVYIDHGINTTGLLDNFVHEVYMKLFLFFSNITLKNVDETFSVSKYLSNQLLKESGIKSKVVYNKIDKKRFNKNVQGKKIIKRHNLKNSKVFLYVGRISPHKGLHLLLESFDIVKKHIPNAKLLIVGKPTFDAYFRRLKKAKSKDVIFTGFVPDNELPSYYAASDVYVSASLWEGFDLPAVEAQSCGKPVVAFDIGSHPEVVKKGILVPKGNVKAFADSMIKFVKSA